MGLKRTRIRINSGVRTHAQPPKRVPSVPGVPSVFSSRRAGSLSLARNPDSHAHGMAAGVRHSSSRDGSSLRGVSKDALHHELAPESMNQVNQLAVDIDAASAGARLSTLSTLEC